MWTLMGKSDKRCIKINVSESDKKVWYVIKWKYECKMVKYIVNIGYVMKMWMCWNVLSWLCMMFDDMGYEMWMYTSAWCECIRCMDIHNVCESDCDVEWIVEWMYD